MQPTHRKRWMDIRTLGGEAMTRGEELSEAEQFRDMSAGDGGRMPSGQLDEDPPPPN